jgi:hypothetical protein
VIVLTIKDAVAIKLPSASSPSLKRPGICALIDDTGPYVSMPGELGTTPSRCIALMVA